MFVLFLSISFLSAGGCSEDSTSHNYPESHRQFHQTHVDFLASYEKSIGSAFSKLRSAVKIADSSRNLMGRWDVIELLYAEFHSGNQIYIEGCLLEGEPGTHRNAMNRASAELRSHYLASQVDIEKEMEAGNISLLDSKLADFERRFVDTISKIKASANAYLASLP